MKSKILDSMNVTFWGPAPSEKTTQNEKTTFFCILSSVRFPEHHVSMDYNISTFQSKGRLYNYGKNWKGW